MGVLRILELRSVWGTGGGPEKTIILGAARADRARYAVTVCYIRDERDPVFGVGGLLGRADVDYAEVREKHSFDVGVWGRLTAVVRERGIDIVHAHDYKTNLLALALGWKLGVKILSTVHGWTGHSFKERCIYYPADKWVLARFPALVAVSSDIRNELIRTGTQPRRVCTILNGIDHEAFRRDSARHDEARRRFGLPDDAFVIGGVGRAEPQKRFDLLLQAFAHVSRSNPRALLVIAGTGSADAQLKALVGDLGLGERVRLLGHCDDVPLLHHALDLFVQSSDYEGTPNAVLEAMAFETPIVATDAGGTAELVRHDLDGLVVSAGNAANLASTIEVAMVDRDRRLAWAKSARRRVEHELSFAARMRNLERIYDNMAAGREPFDGVRAVESPA